MFIFGSYFTWCLLRIIYQYATKRKTFYSWNKWLLRGVTIFPSPIPLWLQTFQTKKIKALEVWKLKISFKKACCPYITPQRSLLNPSNFSKITHSNVINSHLWFVQVSQINTAHLKRHNFVFLSHISLTFPIPRTHIVFSQPLNRQGRTLSNSSQRRQSITTEFIIGASGVSLSSRQRMGMSVYSITITTNVLYGKWVSNSSRHIAR